MLVGGPFTFVDLLVRKPAAAGGSIVTSFSFEMVAVKTISWSQVDERVTFEYGGMVIGYPTKPGHPTFQTTGWNRVKNIQITDPTVAIR